VGDGSYIWLPGDVTGVGVLLAGRMVVVVVAVRGVIGVFAWVVMITMRMRIVSLDTNLRIVKIVTKSIHHQSSSISFI
jgi:hypothetical protein